MVYPSSRQLGKLVVLNFQNKDTIMNKLRITIDTTDEEFFTHLCKLIQSQCLDNTTVLISGEELDYCPLCEKDKCECEE